MTTSNDTRRYIVIDDGINPTTDPMIMTEGELRDYLAEYAADEHVDVEDAEYAGSWQHALDSLDVRSSEIYADSVNCTGAVSATLIAVAIDVVPDVFDEVDVIVAEHDGAYGEGAAYVLVADLIDYGEHWEFHEEEPEGRWRLTTAAFIERTGRGGAYLGRNPDGDSMVEWLDEQDAAQIRRDGLEQWVRDEHAEYGRDPFAVDEEM